MKSRRQFLFRLGALLLLLSVAAAMFAIGRGHTVYFDNRKTEADGETLEAFYRVNVFVDGERAAKLGKGDRGMADTMGQKFSMTLEITENKGDAPDTYGVTLNLPYHMDGILINIPAMMAGKTQDVFLSELEIAAPEETEESPESGEDGGLEGMEELTGDI